MKGGRMPAGAQLRSTGWHQAKEALQHGCETGLGRAELQAQDPEDKPHSLCPTTRLLQLAAIP